MTSRVSVLAVLLAASALPGVARARCSDVSRVVGFSVCHRFGDNWDALHEPRLLIEAGAARHDESFHAATPGWSDATGSTYGADLRFAGYLNGWFYVGAAFTMGFGPTEVRFRGQDAGDFAFRWALGGVAGAAAHLGPVVLRADLELALGLDEASARASVPGGSATDDWFRVGPRVAPRVVAETWLTPYVSLGLAAGTDLVAEPSLHLGALVSFHTVGYDGARAPVIE